MKTKTLRDYINLIETLQQERVTIDPETGKTTPSFADQIRQQNPNLPQQRPEPAALKGGNLPRASAVDREQQTVTVGDKTYKYQMVEPGGIRPRSNERIAIPMALMGLRGIGLYTGLVAGDTVYILPAGEQ